MSRGPGNFEVTVKPGWAGWQPPHLCRWREGLHLRGFACEPDFVAFSVCDVRQVYCLSGLKCPLYKIGDVARFLESTESKPSILPWHIAATQEFPPAPHK